MHLILTGATGLVGAGTLQQMLSMQEVTRISILSRRPVPMAEAHPDKAKVIIHNDFKNYDAALLEELKDAQGCVWALGASQNAVSKEKLIEITRDYPLAAAEAFSTLHPDTPFTFVYVSGEGATHTPGMLTPLFGKVKGEIEMALAKFHTTHPNLRPYLVRPGAVDWRADNEIQQFMPHQALYKKALIPAWAVVASSQTVGTGHLGKVLTKLAMTKGEKLQAGKGIEGDGRIMRNVGILNFSGA